MCFILLFRQGLGKNGEGRVEPIKIEILPPGKSLDACAAIREEKKMAPSQKRKRNRGRSRRLKLAKANEEKVCVYSVHVGVGVWVDGGRERQRQTDRQTEWSFLS